MGVLFVSVMVVSKVVCVVVFCGLNDLLNYQCKHCGGVYCSEHRLPENHNCSHLHSLHPNVWEPKEATYSIAPPVKARMPSYAEYRDRPHRLGWLRKHKRVTYVMLGLAFFLPSLALGAWMYPVYSSFFVGPSVLLLLAVVFPCMIGHDAFDIRFRPVEISETEYAEGGRLTRSHISIRGRSTTKSYRSREMQTPLGIIVVLGLIGLFFLPLILGMTIVFSLLLSVGAVFLGLGCFNINTIANRRIGKFQSKLGAKVLP